jgi:hypothetical protein
MRKSDEPLQVVLAFRSINGLPSSYLHSCVRLFQPGRPGLRRTASWSRELVLRSALGHFRSPAQKFGTICRHMSFPPPTSAPYVPASIHFGLSLLPRTCFLARRPDVHCILSAIMCSQPCLLLPTWANATLQVRDVIIHCGDPFRINEFCSIVCDYTAFHSFYLFICFFFVCVLSPCVCIWVHRLTHVKSLETILLVAPKGRGWSLTVYMS